MPHYLMWFRRDLRIHDNTALAKICEQANQNNAQVSAIFFITPQQWMTHHQSLVQIDLILRSLPILGQSLKSQLNIQLFVDSANTFDDCVDYLTHYCQAHDISKVVTNHEYELNEIERDRQVAQQLMPLNIEFWQFDDQCILPPQSILTQDQQMYRVFTPFYKKWQRQLEQLELQCYQPERVTQPTDENQHCNLTAYATSEAIQALSNQVLNNYQQQWQTHLAVNYSKIDLNHTFSVQHTQSTSLENQNWLSNLLTHARQDFPAGEVSACHRLDQFIAEDIHDYDLARDIPSQQATSYLSPYLAIGSISPRLCYQQAIKAFNLPNRKETDIQRWISELAWRDFYRHVLVAKPELIKHQAYYPDVDKKVNWSYDQAKFQKWCQGMTGVPLVDSAMRCLNATGFMHNRLRMVVAMFLTKDLLIDWRWGEKYFMQTLIDGDFASNNGGWQWSASTGTDAAPYFRIMNPFSQGKTHDSDAIFIKTWLPELKNVESKVLHDEHKLRQYLSTHPTITYPAPMVEHKVARLQAIEQFKSE